MPQSILGLAALMLAAILGISQQRAVIQSYEVRVRDEYAVAASGLVMHVMEMAAARSFDESATPDWVQAQRRIPGLADFSTPVAFGGGTCDLLEPWRTPACDDLDDLGGIDGQRVPLTLPSGEALAFDVSVAVAYVADADPTAAVTAPTPHKRVTVTARAADLERLGEVVRLERVISFDPIKVLAEHEAVHGPLAITM